MKLYKPMPIWIKSTQDIPLKSPSKGQTRPFSSALAKAAPTIASHPISGRLSRAAHMHHVELTNTDVGFAWSTQVGKCRARRAPASHGAGRWPSHGRVVTRRRPVGGGDTATGTRVRFVCVFVFDWRGIYCLWWWWFFEMIVVWIDEVEGSKVVLRVVVLWIVLSEVWTLPLRCFIRLPNIGMFSMKAYLMMILGFEEF